MAGIWRVIIVYMLIINTSAFVIFGIDKRKAIKKQWRIPERTLLGAALIGGSLGALLGMQVFRHKTRHWKFKICVPLFLAMHVGLVILWLMA